MIKTVTSRWDPSSSTYEFLLQPNGYPSAPWRLTLTRVRDVLGFALRFYVRVSDSAWRTAVHGTISPLGVARLLDGEVARLDFNGRVALDVMLRALPEHLPYKRHLRVA